MSLFTKLILYQLSLGIVLVLTTAKYSYSASDALFPQKLKAIVSWDPNDTVPEGYLVYQRKRGKPYDYNRPTCAVTQPPCIIYNLDWDTHYYFVVQAYDGTKVGPDSEEVSFFNPLSERKRYTIHLSNGPHGYISQERTITVVEGYDLTFNIIPEEPYSESNVIVDGIAIGAVQTYTFENITAGHALSARFASIEPIIDADDDGITDDQDAFPYDPSEWTDSDLDGVGDNLDRCLDDPENRCIEDRLVAGQVALYRFDEGEGSVIYDRSGYGEPLDLTLSDPSAVEWIPGGGLAIVSPTIIRSSVRAYKMTDIIKNRGALTIEAWVKPENTEQGGPARIVTLSEDPNYRNFTLSQEKRAYDVRLRTEETSANGRPSIRAENELMSRLSQIVYTRDNQGNVNLFINSELVLTETVRGELSNWQDYFFAIGNELTGDRPWLGELYLVAIYGRSLSAQEVKYNYTISARFASTASIFDADDGGISDDQEAIPYNPSEWTDSDFDSLGDNLDR